MVIKHSSVDVIGQVSRDAIGQLSVKPSCHWGGGGGVKGGTDGRKFISNSSSLSHVTLVKIRTFTFTLLDT